MNFIDFSEVAQAVATDDRQKTDEAVRLGDLKVRAVSDDRRNHFELSLPGSAPCRMSDWAGAQLLQKRLEIPYDFLAQRCSRGLAQQIVDQFLAGHPNAALMIRRIDRPEGRRVRAVLPGSTARFDNADFLEIAAQVADEHRLRVQHFHIDEHSFHCRLLFDEELDGGAGGRRDPHHMGIHLRNSEVGCGVPEANLTVVRQVCSNGLMGFADEPLLRIPASSLASVSKHRLLERFREGVRKGVERKAEVITTIREARARKVEMKSLDEELRKIHKAHGLSVRNVDIVREAFVRESRDSGDRTTTAFTLANALTRAAQHLSGDDRLKYEKAAWDYLKAHSKN